MIIDFHTHIFPDQLAPKALLKLSAVGGFPLMSSGKSDDLIINMKENGVDASVILNVATNPGQVNNVNAFALYIKNNYSNLIPFGSLHPQSENPREILKNLKDNGIKGIKLHPDYVKTTIDDKSFEPIFAAASEMDMPVVIHAGWDFISPDLIHADPDKILKVINRFPDLKLVCAHFGGKRMWDDVLKKLCGKNVYFDTALASSRFTITKEQAEQIIKNHDETKILFGSDLPWCSTSEVKEFIYSLDISEKIREMIFGLNAKKLLDLD